MELVHRPLGGHAIRVTELCLDASRSTLWTSGGGTLSTSPGVVRAYRLEPRGPSVELEPRPVHGGVVHRGTTWSLDLRGRSLVSGGHDALVKLWTVEPENAEPRLEKELQGHEHRVTCVRFSPEGGVVSAGEDTRVLFWPRGQGKPTELARHASTVKSLAFLAGGVLSASFDGRLRFGRLDRGGGATEILAHEGGVWCVTIAPGDRVVATTGADERIRIWDLAGRQLERRSVLAGHAGWVSVAAFHPDGIHLLSGGFDGTVRLWNILTRREIARVSTGRAPVHALRFGGAHRAYCGTGSTEPGSPTLFAIDLPDLDVRVRNF